MSHSKIFFYACLFFILGIFIRSVWSPDFFVAYLILLLAIFCFALSRQNKLYLVLGLWVLCLFLGIWRYQASVPVKTADKIFYYNGQSVEFIGLVNKEPDQREESVKLEIKSEQIIIGDQKVNVSGKVLVTNSLFPQYQYGDLLQINCKLKEPEPIEDFNYDKYLARYDIYSLCYSPKITLLEQNKGNFILTQIYQVKNFFISRINRVLPEPQASFLGGLLIGAKKAIPADLQSVFNKTGTTHIVAVSGYNITIIVAFLMMLVPRLGLNRKKAFWLIIAFLAVFLVITGLQASILRAAVMGAVVLIAGNLGRRSKVANVLVLAAVIMLLFNPKILVFDLGFQLSFLATLGLVYLNPVLIKVCKVQSLGQRPISSSWLASAEAVPQPGLWLIKSKVLKIILNDYLLTTLSAIIMTQPLILYQFGKISLIAPIANILVLPFIPIAMMLGFITGLAAMIWSGLGWVVGWSVWLVLSYIIFALEKLAGLGWVYWEIPKIGIWLMVGLYLVIIGVIYWNKYKVRAAERLPATRESMKRNRADANGA